MFSPPANVGVTYQPLPKGLLLSTVAGNWRGMLPLFSTNAAQLKKIADLRAQLKEAKTKVTKTEQTADKALGASEQLLPTLQETKSRLATLEQDMLRQSERHMAELAQRNVSSALGAWLPLVGITRSRILVSSPSHLSLTRSTIYE
ncbi:hypothetical protein OH76DRAFT_1398345 [Lentinus brumalis]|uniref:Uncharacterized protein n=1 Tax=Lentinus brumalis TaxID=2498619 RepID=A0A371DNC4_9APHY|nr:hypothetical protein OH76DRAFT_1398345 [Polyporus brumalis]